MKIVISGGGGPEFRVSHANREDLLVSSTLTGVQAVEKVAEWLAIVPVAAPIEAVVVVEASDGNVVFHGRKTPKTMPPKDAA